MLKLKSAILDFKNRLYKISSVFSEKGKFGTLQASASPKKIDMCVQNFPLQEVGKIFNKILPKCLITGNLNLSPHQDYFFGTGHLKLEKFISQKNAINLNLKQDQRGLFIQGNLSDVSEDLRLRILIPVFIKHDMSFLIKNNLSIDASIYGNANIENIFESSDGITLRGQIKSALNISGTSDYPKIQGTAECSNMSIIISDIVLKNGTVKLVGQGNKFIVYDSCFRDSYGKQTKIRGDAVLFFSHGVPNLSTNLQLDLDNYRLFDTDSMKINICGSGNMTGSIDNLKLSGNVKVPFCELKFSDSGGENKYKDIIVTNDIFLSEIQKPNDDFFSYDVNLDSDHIKIIGNIYNLECAGKLHLGTYNRKATLSGSVDLKKGRLNLFGKRMIFKKSKIEFLEKFPFDPKMKLSCSRDIDSMKVVLDVQNNPGEGMSLNLRSHPNYTQDVILSYMMFGKSSKDLSVGEAAQLAHAINSMNQKGYIFSILNTFQNIGLVDSLSFSTNNSSSSLYTNTKSSSDKLSIRAGKYLSDNVYISVNQKEEETSFDVDLSVGSNTSLKVNTLGEVGVSWKFRY